MAGRSYTWNAEAMGLEALINPCEWRSELLQPPETAVVLLHDAKHLGRDVSASAQPQLGVLYDSRRPQKSHVREDQLLQNMMFGSLPLALSHHTTKMHLLKDPKRVVLTKLYPTKRIKNLLMNVGGASAPSSVPASPRRSGSGVPRSAQRFGFSSSEPLSEAAESAAPAVAVPASRSAQPQRLDFDDATSTDLESPHSPRSLAEMSDFFPGALPSPIKTLDADESFTSSGTPSHSSSLSSMLDVSGRMRRYERSQRLSLEFGMRSKTGEASKATVCGIALIIDVDRSDILEKFVTTHFAILDMTLTGFFHWLQERLLFVVEEELRSQAQPAPHTARVLLKRVARRFRESRQVTERIRFLIHQVHTLYTAPR
ncbi:uncharacterized protein MONBRDRAFT_25667 [Monosiga brevicollis MX1]|uniref:Uncharacterized protein n=1 Tax=Monosiga brevicollis TaxID=81824 RepID=A9V026_MONBE|nr:uncharacterized protein MONBRDRAFT_25667 [Monosiga brevicollis MX1]EDQ89083.1 predicted protein [Monosiga brevicollis MX1]|eukprot:XP_001746188.1 hypothetical protein [Monosiga brevicollis MX1]